MSRMQRDWKGASRPVPERDQIEAGERIVSGLSKIQNVFGPAYIGRAIRAVGRLPQDFGIVRHGNSIPRPEAGRVESVSKG